MNRYIVGVLALSLYGQQEVVLSPRPSTAHAVTVMAYSGTNLTYLGKAKTPTASTHTARVAGCTGLGSTCSAMTNIVDAANTATVTWASHGLRAGNSITVAGASDADLNGTYIIATVADANTFTFTSANVTDATYTTGVTISTRAPRETDPIWTVQQMLYDGSNNLVSIQQAVNIAWSARATATYQH